MAIPIQKDPDAAAVGVCKYISVDWEEWHFVSRANPNHWHTVHLADYELSGACSCQHFDFNIRPLLQGKAIRPHTPRAKCKHIRRAERLLCYKMKKALFNRTNPEPT